MSLKKAQLGPKGGRALPVLFNPTRYSLSAASRVNQTAALGTAAPVTEYAGAGPRTLTMDLLFDTYEAGTDVRDHTGRVYRLLEPAGASAKAPPECVFQWGRWSFTGMLEDVRGDFTLFLPDGTPVRATLTITMRGTEYVSGGAAAQRPAAATVARRGESLAALAFKAYGSAGRWRDLADANGISNPRDVSAKVLRIPGLR
jgi:hypothetical protein